MNFEVINFVGGINNKIEPHLLDPTYSVELNNAFVENGAIEPLSSHEIIENPNEGEFFYQNGERSITKWGGNYYWSDNVDGSLSSSLGYFGVRVFDEERPTAHVVGTGSAFDGTYKYLFTFETAEGFEGVAFTEYPNSFATFSGTATSIELRGFQLDHGPFIKSVNVYRTLANGNDFYYVGAVGALASTYIDEVSDLQLVTRRRYDLSLLSTVPTRGRFLTELNGVFYIADGTRLYFSHQSNPHRWNPLDYVVFDDDIKGVKAFDDQLIVFTSNRAYLVRGGSVADIFKRELPEAQGVLNWKTLRAVRNSPIWLSNDGVCMYKNYPNRDGRFINILTEDTLILPKETPVSSIVANDVYYLFYSDRTYAFDFKRGMKITTLDFTAEWAYYDRDQDKLFFRKDEIFYEAFSGKKLEFTYKSPDFVMNDMQALKQVSRIHVDADEDVEFDFYFDDRLLHSYKSSALEGKQRRHFLKSGMRGRRFQVRARSQGTLRGYKIEFTYKRF